jgi:hypothetical protein
MQAMADMLTARKVLKALADPVWLAAQADSARARPVAKKHR